VWGAGANAGGELMHAYRDFNLSTIAADNTPQSGPSTAIRFCPPSEGTYHVDIVATAKVQNPTAGHARATIYILSQDASSATQLAAIDLNKATPDAFGHFPARLNYHADVPLKKNEELAVRIQTVNPGPASAGASELTFEQFRVTGP